MEVYINTKMGDILELGAFISWTVCCRKDHCGSNVFTLGSKLQNKKLFPLHFGLLSVTILPLHQISVITTLIFYFVLPRIVFTVSARKQRENLLLLWSRNWSKESEIFDIINNSMRNKLNFHFAIKRNTFTYIHKKKQLLEQMSNLSPIGTVCVCVCVWISCQLL
jgi:hypothetical protein